MERGIVDLLPLGAVLNLLKLMERPAFVPLAAALVDFFRQRHDRDGGRRMFSDPSPCVRGLKSSSADSHECSIVHVSGGQLGDLVAAETKKLVVSDLW